MKQAGFPWEKPACFIIGFSQFHPQVICRFSDQGRIALRRQIRLGEIGKHCGWTLQVI